MKTYFSFIIIILLSIKIHAQPFSEAIHSPLLKAYINSDGPLFYNGYFQAGLSVTEFNDEEVNIHVMYAGGLWLGAKKQDEDFARISRSEYFKEDFLGGPANYDGKINLNRIWIVSGEEIKSHIEDFVDGSIDNYPGINIVEWPGYGNEELGDEFPQREFAPFYDRDNDGIYNAFAGDYPIISDTLNNILPFELAYAVFHDDPLSTNPIGVEVHATMYTLQCDQLPLLDRTVFTSHRIVNISQDYDEFLLGFWFDTDLGCTEDDYVGCNDQENSFYAYNSDNYDGNETFGCTIEYETFENNPAVQSTRFLNHPLHSYSLIYREGAGIDFPIPTLTPETDLEIANRLRGKWSDGSSFTYGGIAYDTSSTDYTNFQYPSDPSDEEGWSMLTHDTPLKDRTSLATITPSSLAFNEAIIFDMVQVVSLDENYNHIEKVALNMDESAQVQLAYDNNFEDLCNTITFNKSFKESEDILIYPNPAKNEISIEQNNEINAYQIIDVTGRVFKKGDISGNKTTIQFDLPNGIYWLILKSKETKFNPKKFFVKN